MQFFIFFTIALFFCIFSANYFWLEGAIAVSSGQAKCELVEVISTNKEVEKRWSCNYVRIEEIVIQ